MSEIVGTSFNQGAALAVLGLILGSVLGWVTILGGYSEAKLTRNARLGFVAMFLLMPLFHWFFTWSYAVVKPEVYGGQASSLAISVLAASAGSFVATLAYLVGLQNVAAVFAKQDARVLQQALVTCIGWRRIRSLVGLMSMVGLVLGSWAFRITEP
jgi:ABC-type amino acid transport system permease subunit